MASEFPRTNNINYLGITVLVRFSIAVRKHCDQNHLGEEGLFGLCIPSHRSLWEVKSETQTS